MTDEQIADLIADNERLRAALAVAKGVCGRNNANCHGAKRVKETLEAVKLEPMRDW